MLGTLSSNCSDSWTDVLNGVDLGFTLIYVAEVGLKWQAAGNIMCALMGFVMLTTFCFKLGLH